MQVEKRDLERAHHHAAAQSASDVDGLPELPVPCALGLRSVEALPLSLSLSRPRPRSRFRSLSLALSPSLSLFLSLSLSLGYALVRYYPSDYAL